MESVLVLFKRDLRVQDNPALALAAARGRVVLPVFVVEPDAWAQPDASARQWRFVAESLADLRADLAVLGAPLVVRTGDMVEVLVYNRVLDDLERTQLEGYLAGRYGLTL